MRLMASLAIAFATYSRIPMPRVDWRDENRRYAFCFFPLIGLVIGGAAALWLLLCGRLARTPLLRGGGAACIPLLVTGGIHMDGFMDTCDALASWQPPEKRLEILKDSHVGAFAVLGCGMYLLLSAGLWAECLAQRAPALCAVFVLSRALSAWLAVSLKPARPDGMLGGFTHAAAARAVKGAAMGYGVLCAAALTFSLRWAALIPLGAAAAVTVYYKKMAVRYFGGVTGDLAGWYLQMTELCCLAGVVIGGKLL